MAGVRDIGPPPVDWKEQNDDRDVSQNTPDPEKEETNLSRPQTNESQHGNTINDTEQRSEETISGLPPMGGGKSYPPDLLGRQEDYLVEFDGPTDPTHPHNWPMRTRLVLVTK
jgi:DHA1 family multidrug resistance protein-like MFS transporter